MLQYMRLNLGRQPSPSKRSFAKIIRASNPQIQASSVVKPLGQCMGQPIISFFEDEIQILAIQFRFSLVGKLSKGHPSMDGLRKDFQSVSFRWSFTLGLLDPRHVLI